MERTKSVARELKILSNMLNRKAEASLAPYLKEQVTEKQGRVIGFLAHSRETPIFQKDVEAEFSITRATASKMLTQMERNGLIVRSGVAGDARLKRLELTEKALCHMEKIRQGMLSFEAELTRGLTDEEKAALLALLRRLEQNVAMDHPCTRKGEPLC